MSEIEYFFGQFFIYLFCTSVILLGPYICSKLSWIIYSKNCLDIFKNQLVLENKLPKFPLILKIHQYKCLFIYLFFGLFNVGTLIIFWYLLWLETKNDNKYLIIPFIIVFLISCILLYFLIKKNLKEMSLIGVYDKKEAIVIFDIYYKNFVNNSNANKFELIKNDQIASRNKPFQFNQKRYKRKIQKLKNKKLKSEDFKFKLLKIYINYLKTYALFFKAIEKENESSFCVIVNEQKSEDLEVLKNLLINNFFAFYNKKK